MFCIEMNRNEQEFENSSMAKVIELIELHRKFKYPDPKEEQNQEMSGTEFNQIVKGKAVKF